MEKMNLVQSMVAENRQSVTSVELAEATGLTHVEICQFLKIYLAEIASDEPLQKVGDEFILSVDQTLAAILFLEMSEEEKPTPADRRIAALKLSFIKVFKTRMQAEKRGSDVRRRTSADEWS